MLKYIASIILCNLCAYDCIQN